MTDEERREHNREYQRKWRREHPGYMAAYHRRYYQKHREEVLKRDHEWYRKKHPKKEKKGSAPKIKPEGCVYPDCERCQLPDCTAG